MTLVGSKKKNITVVYCDHELKALRKLVSGRATETEETNSLDNMVENSK